YSYRQDSDFYYMTGFPEPEAVVVLAPGRASGEYLIFCREKNSEREQWDGKRAGQAGAVETYGADDAFPIDDLDDILPGIMESCIRIYYTMGMYAEFDSRMADWVNTLGSKLSRGVQSQHEFVALDHLLHDMRLFKSRAELSAMRKSAKVAVAAHKRAMQVTRPGMYEYEVEAEFSHEFRRNSAWASYNPIVAGGKNACILHYVENDQLLNDGDLLLIDAGCELNYYASDVTRTFPVNGRFTAAQRAVYEIVLEAQRAAIEKTVVGNHWNEPHDAAVQIITKGLKKLGLLEGSLPKLMKDGAYQPFYMHRTGHWIGIDVHDVGDYKVGNEWRMLESGMVTTVEPGIYIGDSRKIPKEFRNIGIRIEDDVAITSMGPDVLSKGLVSDPDDIEALMNAASD
ncbi:MAG: aminopeptidase P N-terminal domain-containing protein, partial [Woeseiaceae bacterium]|nr:aminopeptidase P N-terminal domain-containing protein [Woeseiaceae bacterium]